MSCFWKTSPVKATDDCVPLQVALNLKTANMENSGLAVPPAPSLTSPDPVGDVAESALSLGPRIVVSMTQPITVKLPLRSLGGNFAIGATTYSRPPAFNPSNQTPYMLVLLSFPYDFYWFYAGGGTLLTTGYLNATCTFYDASGTAVQTTSWCDLDMASPVSGGSGGYIYSSAPVGAVATGQNQGTFGSSTLYELVRVAVPVTSFPTTDFDGGTLACTLTPSSTSKTGVAGSTFMADEAGNPGAASVTGMAAKMVLVDTGTPFQSLWWDF